jgi:pyruvate/2-oxoglutarate dehydrogenase complex dihydrolipoamide acyltransferase (E2) component
LRSVGGTNDPLETHVAPTIATPIAPSRAPRASDSVKKDVVKPAPKAASVAPAPAAQPLVTNKPIAEPLARAALSFVGMDAEAEIVWASTINDPSVDPDTRKNLIEDLNEDGFPDPKHISPDDLPLILKRIELIENHAPLSMDEVNAAAFQEAYKDLLNMAEKAARG